MSFYIDIDLTDHLHKSDVYELMDSYGISHPSNKLIDTRSLLDQMKIEEFLEKVESIKIDDLRDFLKKY